MRLQGKSESKPFRFEMVWPYLEPPPQITKGHWWVDADADAEEYEILDEQGEPIALIDAALCRSNEEIAANAQCISLVPELVRAVCTAMRALQGTVPDNETEKTVADALGELLRRCSSFPPPGDTLET